MIEIMLQVGLIQHFLVLNGNVAIEIWSCEIGTQGLKNQETFFCSACEDI